MTSYILSSVPVSFPGLGINDIPVSRVAFTIGSLSVYWYGICIVLAFILCVGLAMKQSKSFGYSGDDIVDYALVVIPTALVGARLYYILFTLEEFSSNWLSVFDTRKGGLAVYGGIILSVFSVFVMARKKKKSVSSIFDYLIVYIPLGQAIGRWGNFVNQEAFGTNTELPWGMISSQTSWFIKNFAPDLNPDLPVHPTFLYESLATLAIFIILLSVRKRSVRPYTTTALYCILYGVVRFFIEGLRTDSLYIGNSGLRSSQVLSAILVVGGFVVLSVVRYMNLRRSVPIQGENLSEDEAEILSKYSISLATDETDAAEADAVETDVDEAETAEAETVEAETVEADVVEAETVEADIVEADIVEAEAEDAETADIDETKADDSSSEDKDS